MYMLCNEEYGTVNVRNIWTAVVKLRFVSQYAGCNEKPHSFS